jgi:hypothetical protein
MVCEGGLMVLSDCVADAEWEHARHVPCSLFRIMSSPACALITSGALAPCFRFCSSWNKYTPATAPAGVIVGHVRRGARRGARCSTEGRGVICVQRP